MRWKRGAFDYEFDEDKLQNAKEYNSNKQFLDRAKLEDKKKGILKKDGGDEDEVKKKPERGFKVSEIDPDKLIYKDRDCVCNII